MIGHSKIRTLFAAACLLAAPQANTISNAAHYEDRSEYFAPRATVAPTIDGVASEPEWASAEWRQLTHRWLGPEYSSDDFQGRYKIVWTEDKIFILGEFVDDVLIDSHRDPLLQYWDDDCFEIFIDEDFSGGEHQYNHNAFAYHVSLDNQTVDIGADELPHNYSHHIESRWQQLGNKIIWELAIDIYRDDYVDGSLDNKSAALFAGKILGLMLAYCDNDGSEHRENFIGSENEPDGPQGRGWIDAGLFGTLVLEE